MSEQEKFLFWAGAALGLMVAFIFYVAVAFIIVHKGLLNG
jgi:hypothetical protein